MAQYIMYDSLDILRGKFIEKKLPFYIVCDSHNNILFSNESESDEIAAAEMLCNDLKDIRKESQIIFNIKLFKTLPKGGFKKTSESENLMTYQRKRINNLEDQMSGGNYINSQILNKLDSIQASNEELKMRIAMLENDEGEDEEIQTEPQSILGAIVSNPSFQEVIINLITNISANLMTNNKKALSLAGTDTMETIIERLISKGVTVDDLQKLSLMSNDKISMLLTMLRAN